MAKKKKINKQSSIVLLSTIFLVLMLFVISFVSKEDLGPQLPPPPPDAAYKQANLPINTRVQDLLSRMTLEEKIEEERAKLPAEGGTPVTKESFLDWKKRRAEKK